MLGPYYHGIISTQPSCHLCPLRYKKPVFPDGPVPAMIAFVGEAPASSEEKQGRCFVGPSGSMMWDVLGPEADIVREQCWVTNAQLCRIEKVRLSTGAVLPKDTVQEMASRCCRLRLIHELQTVNPRVIMPLGETALQSVIGVPGAKIYPYRGSIQEVDLQALAQKAYEELNEQA